MPRAARPARAAARGRRRLLPPPPAMLGTVPVLLTGVGGMAAAFNVQVSVGASCATTMVSSLTSVTMDVCLAKQGFPFTDPDLLRLTAHLGGGPTRPILRIGGSDQNSFYYDMVSTQAAPFSPASGGGKCCDSVGSCRGCAHDCTMPAAYWKSITAFANSTGHKLMFGLVPDMDSATSLVTYSAQERLPVFAFTYGNEEERAKISADYPKMRKLLDSSYEAGAAPKLAGPDTYVQRNYEFTLDEAYAGKDKTITQHLTFMSSFATKAGSTLDAFSWHTYDYETPMIGMSDHHDLVVNPLTSRLWSTRHLDFAARLQGNVSSIVQRAAPQAEVWISESNSICHQGVNGVTNAYLNSVWLVNRLGIMAHANVSVMARQSLVGYNYSLLGNWPVEKIQPNPDYYTSVLFKRLFGNTVLATTSIPSQPGPPATNITEGGDRARAFAFCASDMVSKQASGGAVGALSVAMINFDEKETATFEFDQELGIHQDYVLAPGPDPLVMSAPWSSRKILLNGELLHMHGPEWKLPAGVTGTGKLNSRGVMLGPLNVGFAVFLSAGIPHCKG